MRILKHKIRSRSLPQIIINYCVIIDAIYDYIIHAYIYNRGLLEEYDKEETVVVTVAATICCFTKKTVQRFIQYHVFTQSAGNSTRNIQSTLPTAPELCKNVPFLVLFGSNGNSYTISTQSDMCVFVLYTHLIYITMCVCVYIYSKTCLKRTLKGPENFSAKGSFRLIKVDYIQYKKLNQDMHVIN